jgi:glucoamylase
VNGERQRSRIPRRISWVAASLSGLTLGSVVLVAAIPHPPGVPPLYAAGIAENPCAPHNVIVVPAGSRQHYYASSNVLETTSVTSCQQAAIRADRQWLSAGFVPGGSPQITSMATRALLDLHLSTRPDGAVIAGWHNRWEYSWPRDSSWTAVALAVTGHTGDSLRILRFLQRTQLPLGTWAARYRPDSSGSDDDGRPGELDANGWVPWAVWCWSVAERQESASENWHSAERQLDGLWPMVRADADATVRSLSPDGLPAASMDYWEESVEVTLSTAAALLTGLRAAADIAGDLGYTTSAADWAMAATRLADGIAAGFGRYGYHRLPYTDSGDDAAVTFLGPPFADADPAVVSAITNTERSLRLPNGGILPGTDWPGNRTTAWTAETAFFALADAGTGNRQQATQLLTWLAMHATRLGTLPEKVDARGRPVSAAPLAWTDAAVLLALAAQAHPLPVVPVPAG